MLAQRTTAATTARSCKISHEQNERMNNGDDDDDAAKNKTKTKAVVRLENPSTGGARIASNRVEPRNSN